LSSSPLPSASTSTSFLKLFFLLLSLGSPIFPWFAFVLNIPVIVVRLYQVDAFDKEIDHLKSRQLVFIRVEVVYIALFSCPISGNDDTVQKSVTQALLKLLCQSVGQQRASFLDQGADDLVGQHNRLR